MAPLNETHDPGLRSWVESARQPGCDFPIQNLPHGVFRSALRRVVSRLLREGTAQADDLRSCLVAPHLAEYAVPARIGNYTDFFTSPWHALNAGRIFQPANPLLPNFKWLPIGYHGRASFIETQSAHQQ